MKRVLVSDPDADVRTLLDTTLRRLGYEPVHAGPTGPPPPVDALLLEPASSDGRSLLDRYREPGPPVICLSIYPREDGLAPDGSVAYLVKPSSRAELGDALHELFAA